ncbi:MAG: tandem-95 repeat protein [Magnetococcales bacterium]|nr:tandem-95 repeat protein [Magnetococcales bacterium]MBF0150437.1 tandem-95 repeat protein [Magnetococcales bacterium]
MKKTHDSKTKCPSPPGATLMADSMMMVLEPRVLFDGALVATARDLLDERQIADGNETNADMEREGIEEHWQPALEQLATAGGSVMFIDTGVVGWQSLLDAADQGMEVVLLDPEHDGMARITAFLAQRSQLEAIHIVSHGRAGEILLGSARLTLESLERASGVLSQWGSALSENGDFLIYGCDVGAGERGEAFITAIAASTGADVAASIDATGSTHLGGDWELELERGVIDRGTPFNPGLLTSFHGLLEAPIAVPGVYDHGITLDGVNDRVDLDDRTEGKFPLNRTQGTISLWFKIDENYATTLGKTGFVFANVLNGGGDLIHLHVESTGSQNWNLFGGLDGYNNVSIATARAGQWHHAALTWRTDGTGDIFLDGQRVKNYAAGVSFSSTNAINSTVAIGTYADTGSFTFPGSVAELRIWNSGLSTTAATALSWVRADMTTTSLTGGEAGLTGYYPLNDGVTNPADTTANDTKSGINAPLLPAGQPQWITRPAEGGAGVTVSLGGSDADGNAITKATLTSIPNATTQGSLYLPSDLGTPLAVNTQILTASDALRRVVFVPVANFDGTATWNFTVNDGTADSSAATVTITMAPAQDAPTLTAAAPTLTTITENDTTNAGQTVASFAGSAITDVDTSPTPSEGIAITAVSGTYGSWQYDTGGGWQSVGAVSGTSALLLRDTDKVRFVPDGLHGESAGLTYRAWDQTSGATGTKVDVSSNGGATAFSTGTDTAALTVTEVIDAPQINVATGDQVVFDGNNDYIRSPTFVFPTSAFTIEMWWRPDTNLTSASARQDLLYCDSGTGRPHISFNKNGGGEIGVFTKIGGPSYDTAVSTTTSWTAGQWYHLAFTFDGTNTSVYVNGQLERQVSQPGVHDAQTGFYLGARSNLANDLRGSLADVRVWSTVRSQTNIQDFMSRALVGNEAGLSGYWPLDEGSGTTVTDDAGSADGTITAATWSSTDAVRGMEEEDIAIPGLSITDVDATGNETVTLTVTSGVLTVNTAVAGGVGAGGVTGNGTATVTLVGTLAQLNATLAGTNALTYRGNTNFYGSDTLNIGVTDSTGGTASGSVAITVYNVIDPLAVTAGGALTFTEGDAATSADGALTLANDEGGNLTGGQVAITAGYVSGQDLLSFVNTAAITGSWNAGTGILTLSGSATVADYQTALRSITYSNSAGDNPTAGVRTLSWTATNAFGTSPASQSTITVQAVNDRPVMTASAVLNDQENDAAAIVDATLTVTDADNTTLQGATVAITGNFVTGEDRLVFVNQSGISGLWDGVTGILTLSGPATLANYQTALRSVRYINDDGDTPQVSTRTVQYSVTDGTLTSVAVQASINVMAVNDAPVITVPAAGTVNEDQSLTLTGISVADVDVGAGTMQLALSVNQGILSLATTTGLSFTAGANGSATMTVTGTVSAINNALNGMVYQPNGHYFGADGLILVANDLGGSGTGGAKTASVTHGITVTAVQDVPVAGIDATTAFEDVPEILTIATELLANDTDADGDVLTLVSLTNPTHGTLVDNGNGTLTYLSSNNYHGTDSFTYTVNDGHGNTSQATVTIVVNAVPDSLQAIADTATTNEEVAVTISVLDNDRDPDFLPDGLNPALAVIGFTDPAHGQVIHLGNGVFTYTPDIDYAGADSFTYTLNAGDARMDIGTVTLTVNNLNDAPVVAVNTGAAVVEGASVTLSPVFLRLTDAEQAATQITLTLVTAPVRGNLELNGVSLTAGQSWTRDDMDQNRLLYRHDGSETIADSFIVTAADGVGGSLLATLFSLTVIPSNDDPVLVQGGVTVDEGGDVTLSSAHLAATDAEEGATALVYTLDALPGSGTLLFNGVALGLGGQVTQADIDAGRLVYRHGGSETTTDNFSIHINDSQGGSVATTVQGITINPVNDAPVWTLPGARTPNEDQDFDVTGISLADADLGAASIQVTATVAHGILTLTTTTGLTFVSGGNGTTTWTISGTLADVTTALAHVTYHGQANYNGSDSLILSANDGGGSGSGGAKVTAGSVTLTVQPVNDLPSMGNDTFVTAEDTPLTMEIATGLMLNDVDPDGGVLTFSSFTQPTRGTVVQVGATLVYTPTAQYNGVDSFTYSVVNARGETATATVNLIVAPLADTLNPGDDAVSLLEDGSLTTGNLLDNDRDPDFLPDGINPALSIIGFSPAAFGTLTYLGGGQFNYVPNADFNGIDGFSYTLSAGDLRTGTATVTMTVTAVNDNPQLTTNTGLSLNEGGQVVLTNLMLKAQDAEQSSTQVQFILATAPSHGTLALDGVALATGAMFSQDAIDNHRLTYTHDGGETTSDPFVLTVSDGVGGFLLNQTVAVSVTAVNDAPQLAINTGVSVAEGANVVLTPAMLTVTDAESATNAIVYTLTTIPTHGSLRRDGVALSVGQTLTQAELAASRIDYLHNGSDTLSDSFKFTVSDGQGGSFAETPFVITVTPVNDPLTVTAGGAKMFVEGDTASSADGALTLNDADGTTLTGAQVTIATGYQAGEDLLGFVNTAAITGVWNAGTGILSLSGVATLADYQTALRSVTYGNAAGDAPTAGVRTLEWRVTDLFETSPVSSSTVTVQAVNDRPIMVAGGALAYQENDTAAIIDASLTVTDADNTLLQGATVVISSNHVVGEDRLVFVNQGGISGSWDGVTGTLTLTGSDTVANYQTALRSVRYVNDQGDTPQASTRQIQFSIDDGQLTSVVVTASVAVTALNDAPVVTIPGPRTVDEDLTLILAGISVADADLGAGTMQLAMAVNHGVILLGTTTGLNFISGGDGSATMTFSGSLTALNDALNGMTYQPDANDFGSDSLTLVANDLGGSGSGGIKTTSVSLGITINPLQDLPVTGIDTTMALEDIPTLISVATDLLANDVDVDGDSLTLVSFTLPSHGSLVDNGNGTLTYLSSQNYHGLDTFTYTVDDGHGNTDLAVVTIVVNPVPDSLIAVNDSAVTMEEMAVNVSVLGNDRDPDFLPDGLNPLLQVIGFTDPSHGQVIHLGNGQFTYTPDTDFDGSDSFTYILNTGDARIDIGTVTLTVNGQNDSPSMVTPAGGMVLEGGTVTLTPALLAVTDPEQTAAQITLTLVNTPIHGTLELNGVALASGQTWTREDVVQHRLVYRHDGSETLTDQFSVTAADGVGGTMLETTFNLTVSPFNDTPSLTLGVLQLVEGGQVTLGTSHLAATDTEGGAATLDHVLDALPTHGQLLRDGVVLSLGGRFTQAEIDAGRVVYRHDGSDTIHDSFNVHVTDPQGAVTASASLNIDISPDNDSPVWSLPGGQTVDEDQAVTITGVRLADTDVGVGVIQVSLSVAHGTLTLPSTTSLVSVAGGNGTGSWTFSGTLAQVNAALSQIMYRGRADFQGLDQLVLVANDGGASGLGGAKVAVGEVLIVINPVADSPNAGMDAFSTAEDTAITLALATDLLANDNDPDGLSFSFTNFTQPAHGSLVRTGSSLVYTPEAQFNGIDQFTYSIVNVQGGTATALVRIVVAPLMDTLSPGDDHVRLLEDGSITTVNLLANDRDPDDLPDGRNPALNIIGFTPTAFGSLVYRGDGRFTYTPMADYHGLDHFSYALSTGDRRLDHVWVVIEVTPDNDVPVMVSNTGMSLEEGGRVVLTRHMFEARDVEQSAAQVSFVLATAPSHGVITVNGLAVTSGGMFTQEDINHHRVIYTHDGGESINDPFVVTVTDGAGGFLLNQSVAVTVTAVNDAPRLLANTGLTVAEGGSGLLSPTALSVVDAESGPDAILYRLASIPVHGGLYRSGIVLGVGQTFTQADLIAGRIDYRHDGSETLADEFRFEVQDGQGSGLLERACAITITPVNEPPVLTVPESFSVLEDVDTPLPGFVVGDPEIGSGSILVRLAVEHGTISVSELPGLQFQNGRNHTASMTLVGNVNLINQALATLRYQGTHDYSGIDTLHLLVSDQGHGGTVPEATTGADVLIQVTAVADTPLPGMDVILPPTDHPIAINEPVLINLGPSLLHNDHDGDGPNSGLTLVGFTQPRFGTLEDRGNGQFVYIPNANFAGFDQFSYTVTDATGNYAFTTVVIINPIEEGLEAGADALILLEDEPTQTGNLLLNDRDLEWRGDGANPALTIIAFTQGAHGTVAYVGNHAFLYIPNHDFQGTDQFTYTLNAGDRRIDIATVRVTVKPVNDLPRIGINAGITLMRGEEKTIGWQELSVLDVDNVERELVYHLEKTPNFGRLFLAGVELVAGGRFTQEDITRGRLVYRNQGETRADRFRFSVDDSSGGFIVTTDFVIQVNPGPEVPAEVPVIEPPVVVAPPVVNPPVVNPPVVTPPVVTPPVTAVRPVIPVESSSRVEQVVESTPTVASGSFQLEDAGQQWWGKLGQRPMEVMPSPAPSGSVSLMGMDVEYASSPILTVVRGYERSVALDASGTPLLTAVMNASPGVEDGGVVTPVLNAVKRAGRSVAPGASVTPVLAAVVASRPEGTPMQLGSPFPDQGPNKGFFMPGLSFMPWFPEPRSENPPTGTDAGTDAEQVAPEQLGTGTEPFLVPVEEEGFNGPHPTPQPAPKPVLRQMRFELSEQFNQLALWREREVDRLRRAFV